MGSVPSLYWFLLSAVVFCPVLRMNLYLFHGMGILRQHLIIAPDQYYWCN